MTPRRVVGRRRCLAWGVVMGLAIDPCRSLATATLMLPATPPAHARIAGLIVNGEDSGQSLTLAHLPGEPDTVAVKAFAQALGLMARDVPGGMAIDTPLGAARLPDPVLRTRDGERYATLATLAHALAARITFDPAAYAVRVRLPWAPGQGEASPGEAADATAAAPSPPDVQAPVASLSAVHSETDLNALAGQRSWNTLVDLQGALGPGAWRARAVTGGPGGQAALQYYGWMLDRGGGRLYLGHDTVALDPLLPTANLTGAQYAWSNRPDLSYGEDLGNHEVVASQTLGSQTIAGQDGPPGGAAVLRINGQVVARTTVLLDGSWAFQNVTVRPTDTAQVALYDGFGQSTPVRVVEVHALNNARALPGGAWVAYAGLGAEGNPLDPAVGTHGLGGFYQLRWGWSDRLTVAAAGQRTGGEDYGVVNAVMGLGGLGTWAVGWAQQGGANAWSVQGNGQAGRWYWDGYALRTGADYLPGMAAASDRYGEVGLHVTPRLNLAVVARAVTQPWLAGQLLLASHDRYIKPALSWQATDTFGLSIQPDYDGRYDYTAQWAATSATAVSVSRYAGLRQAELTHQLSDTVGLDVAATVEPGLGTRYAQTLHGLSTGRLPVTWSAGVLEGRKRLGYQLDTALSAASGWSFHAQVYDDPIQRGVMGGPVLQLAVVTDFAVTAAGVTRSSRSALLSREGAIAGRLRGVLPEGVTLAMLAGVAVRVDGRQVASLDVNGRYVAEHLAPGVHRVTLDTDKLPIELAPLKPALSVEVKAGATTHADLAVVLQLGLAGRVWNRQGLPASGVAVRIEDDQGKPVASVQTDALGYYRVDTLPPGTYTVRVDRDQRVVTLTRRFVFGQDLRPAALPQGPQGARR